MRYTVFAALLFSSTALAQTPPPLSENVETTYSEAQREEDLSLSRRTIDAVLTPMDSVEDQYARWRRPLCINVYGLAPMAKYVIEKRIRDIARQVGAPVEGAEDCAPNVLVAFTIDQMTTLQSIADVRPWLVPGLGQIRSRIKQSQPVQAWYATLMRGKVGWVLEYDGLEQAAMSVSPWHMTRLNSGIETQIGAATIVVDTNAIMGKSLGALADHFALLALAQGRTSDACKPVQTIANLMRSDCDPAWQAQEITAGDIALLTGLYQTPDDVMQRIQKIRIIGNMRKTMEAQEAGK